MQFSKLVERRNMATTTLMAEVFVATSCNSFVSELREIGGTTLSTTGLLLNE